MLIYLIAGLTTGSVFGLAGVGLVLTYRTTGIFNFAHGATATASVFAFYYLYAQLKVPWPIAALATLVVIGGGLGLAMELISRRLPPSSTTRQVVATVGALLVIQGAVQIIYDPGVYRSIPQYLPTSAFHLGNTPVEYYRVIIFGVGLAAVVVLTLVLKRLRLGLAMRAVVDNEELLDISGTNPPRVRRYAWLIGSVFAALSGVLVAPLLSVDATSLTFLVITAFGAGAIGVFRSLPLTYVGGLAIGIGQAYLQKYFSGSTSWTSSLAAGLPFIVLFALLLFARRLPAPGEGRSAIAKARAAKWRPPASVRASGLVILLVVLMVVPSFAGTNILDWSRMLAYGVLFLSLGLLVRLSGQISLAHVTFMAIGVTAFVQATHNLHLPWLIALIFCGLVTAPIGALLAIPAIRFSGVYLALATLGFGLIVQSMFYGQSYMFGAFGIPLAVPRPDVSIGGLSLSSDNGYYYLLLVILAVVSALMLMIEHSRLGRLLRALSDSPTGVTSTGVSINVTWVLVFCLSASFAAVAGALDGGALGYVSSDSYLPITSIQLFAIVMITLGPTPLYAVLAAFAQTALGDYINSSTTVTYYLTVIFGVSAIAIAMKPDVPFEVPVKVREFLDRFERQKPAVGRWATTTVPSRAQNNLADQFSGGNGDFQASGITVRYGGFVAAKDVTIRARTNGITGLIGPNGAGKSSVFNAYTGIVRPASGEVKLGMKKLSGLGASGRARAGLGRSFQRMELFDSLTVRENVALGAEGALAGSNPAAHLVAFPHQRRDVLQRGEDALDLCGLRDVAEVRAGALSTGQRRLVELARCAAGRFQFLLLDEPSSGLDRTETERFGEILLRLVDERGMGILLIEHDMNLVTHTCEYVYVLDFGTLIYEGPTAEALSSPIVRSAYLGNEFEVERVTSPLTESELTGAEVIPHGGDQ